MKPTLIPRATTCHSRRRLLAAACAAAFLAAGCEQALQVAPSSATIALSAASPAIDVSASTTVTATVTDSSGAPVADGTLVTFSTTIGTLDPIEARTGNGRATVRLVAGVQSGVAEVTASSGGVKASPLTIRIGAQPGQILLSVSQTQAGAADLYATVFDVSGMAIPGVSVTFSSSAGTVAASTVVTDPLGQARNTLYASADAVVTASVGGVSASITVRVGGSRTLAVNITMAPGSPARRELIVFTATVTSVGGSVVPVERYEWDFGDEQVTTTGNVTSRAYQDEGRYAVTLRVYGVDGSTGLTRFEFYVD